MSSCHDNNDSTNNRQKILDAATALIMAKGVKGTSLADIARTAGISKGTLFYHFAAKDDLVYELTEQHFDELTRANLRRVEQMQNVPLQEILRESLMTILRAEDRGKLNLYLLQEAVTEKTALKKRFAAKYREFQDMMGEFLHIVFPQMDSAKARTLSMMLVALLDGLIIQWLLEPERIPVDDIASLLAQMLNDL